MLILEALRRGLGMILLRVLTRMILPATILYLATGAGVGHGARKTAIPMGGVSGLRPSELSIASQTQADPWSRRQILAIEATRRILGGLVLLAVAGLVALAIFTRLNTTLVIRGSSMEPALPLGSLVTIDPVDAGDLHVGDVVTVTATNGVLVTHRVSQVIDQEGSTYLELKGDANASSAPDLAPYTAVRGRITAHLPLAGYLAALLATPSGLVSLLTFLASLLVAITLLEEYRWCVEDAAAQRRSAAAAGGGGQRVPA